MVPSRTVVEGRQGRRGFLAGVAVAASLVGASSCRQIVGVTDNPPTDLTATVCALPYGTTSCASCVSANCCSQSNACAADPVCAAYESCLGKCYGDPRCRSQCMIDRATGTTSEVSALSACLVTQCENDCSLSCGALAGYAVEPDTAGACQSCIAANACPQTLACATSADCDAVNRCQLAGHTSDCSNACIASKGFDLASLRKGGDAGGGTYGEWIKAIKGACAGACGLGSYWECIGHVSWPLPKSPTTTITFDLTDLLTGAAVAWVDVSACVTDDVPCSRPLATGTTDAAGHVSLPPFHNGIATTGGTQIGVNGYLKVASPIPTYWYWGFPLSEAQWSSYTAVATAAEWQQIWVNITLDQSRGVVAVLVYDCMYNPAAGVDVALDTADGMTQALTSSGALTKTTTTDAMGALIFANVPAGGVKLTATPKATGGKVSSTITGYVRAGSLTYLIAFPTP